MSNGTGRRVNADALGIPTFLGKDVYAEKELLAGYFVRRLPHLSWSFQKQLQVKCLAGDHQIIIKEIA